MGRLRGRRAVYVERSPALGRSRLGVGGFTGGRRHWKAFFTEILDVEFDRLPYPL